MLLSANETLLLIVDIQERLLPAMQDGARVLRNTGILLQAAQALQIPVAITEQYPKGLGATEPGIRAAAGAAPVLEKMHFSAWADPGIRAHIAQADRQQIVIAGIEAHVCVLQTALELAEHGYRVAVVADAVSSRQTENVQLAQQRMERDGVMQVSTEMCLFEWLGTAAHPQFKTLSRLIR